MLINIISAYRNVIALCDEDLIGKVFYKNSFQLEIKENFYKCESKSKEEIIEILKDMSAEDATFNIVGKESIQTALEAGIISKNEVKEISGIPFALVLL